jgi:hypothetical protein
MNQSIVQVLVKRLLGDKILLGLVIAGLLGIVFVFCTDSPEEKKAPAPAPAPIAASAPPPQMQTQLQAQQPGGPAALDAKVATDFVTYWMSLAMDFSQSARTSHNSAWPWMTPEAAAQFKQVYWPPELEAGVLSGQISAAYQPATVQAEAQNPDGSIVVGATGTLMMQQNGAGSPMSQPVTIDFLVRRERSQLRIAGLYFRQAGAGQVAAAPAPQGSPY